LWATVFLRLYFRRTIVYGLENVPTKGPLIVASNHPSAFLEASLLGTVLGRPLHYLVRGDMFHPKFQWLFDWTNQIPIYRQKDGIGNLRKNASSFDLTYRKLAKGDAVVIFPEAKTTLEKKMRPIQRGTAHLAFGTLPFLQEGDGIHILPVGVNYTEPRLPGTDVLIKVGSPFLATSGARDDREAIDSFTENLSDVLSPLIIQIPDEGRELSYDVMASVYYRFVYSGRPKGSAHHDLLSIAYKVNEHPEQKNHMADVHSFIQKVKRQNIKDAIYFPDMITSNRVGLLIILILKLIWLIAGGWIWRGVRHMIFSKIKANTFKTPVSVGASMVLFPLIAILFVIACLLFGWPVWIVPAWLLLLVVGIFFRPPFQLIWKSLTMSPKAKSALKKDVIRLKEDVVKWLAI
ncbi:MAG: 1-acyl-sn-glycerol-3-phosphate acyltransferase, partial [Saprospiraceae bacterium]|nr:1-acyl-sn-glycerol-3-phosphate acyltransferase [Saprospiraceae bacterium]